MRVDDLKVEYSNHGPDGHTTADIRPGNIGSPFWRMSVEVQRTGSPEQFKRDIVQAARRLAAEITEIDTGIDLKFDPDAEVEELVEHAGLIPSGEWLRRYSLVARSIRDDITLEDALPKPRRGPLAWLGIGR